MKGGGGKFKLPKELQNKQCLLNIESPTDMCFKYAIVAALHHNEIISRGCHKNNALYYVPFIKQYNFDGICFPASAEDVVKFQKLNMTVAINALLYVAPKNDKPFSI